MAEDIDGDNLAYSIASSGKLVCSLIGRIMAEDKTIYQLTRTCYRVCKVVTIDIFSHYSSYQTRFLYIFWYGKVVG
jgi:hypothetical protein